ncbi:hypothetical protein EYC80_003427 [Monilinia laxa]|uniref:Uncharacterized protein n=1 Tax=Monilinia laxa TaxID=61186 RepID=A0A5N6KDX3_MONLA|nr:hypothetical protein EYC80_003427 [Monilinia laxa]
MVENPVFLDGVEKNEMRKRGDLRESRAKYQSQQKKEKLGKTQEIVSAPEVLAQGASSRGLAGSNIKHPFSSIAEDKVYLLAHKTFK